MLEIVTPRTNTARLSPAENLFGAIALRRGRQNEPVALEIVTDGASRPFQVRTTSAYERARIATQLGAAYPQAAGRPLDVGLGDKSDAAQQGLDEQIATCALRLQRGEHLPLRTFDDRDLDARGGSAQADPILVVFSAMADLPRAWRALVQIIVVHSPAPADWTQRYQRLALERPLEQDRARDAGPSLTLPLGLLGIVGVYLLYSYAANAWSRGDWPAVAGLTACGTVGLALAVGLASWLSKREIVDPKLVSSNSHATRA